MNKTKIKIDKAVLHRTTNCKHDFRCLSGKKKRLCKVTGSVGFDIKIIKPKAEIDCKYRLTYGNGSLCVCPTRNDLYNRYKI